MEVTSQGIVLRTVKYNDRYNIVDFYTEQLGKCSALVLLPKSSRSRAKNNFYQPLFLLELTLYRKGDSGLFRVKDVRCVNVFSSIPYNPYKTSIVLFLAETIYRVIYEDEANRPLFLYIFNSLLWLDSCEGNFSNFHLVFLMRLPLFLGISPNLSDYEEGDYFDILNGSFSKSKPTNHSSYVSPSEANKIVTLMRMNFDTMHLFKLNGKERATILSVIIDYYKVHIPTLSELKSFEVLKDLFNLD